MNLDFKNVTGYATCGRVTFLTAEENFLLAITSELVRGRLNGDSRFLLLEGKRQKREANQSQYSTEEKKCSEFYLNFPYTT